MENIQQWDGPNLDGIIGIATRLKRLSEILANQVQEVYDNKDRNFKVSWFTTMANIKQEGEIDFKTLASRNNVSPSAVSQVIADLKKHKMVEIKPGLEDRRSKTISLTKKGNQYLESIIPDLSEIEVDLVEVFRDSQGEFLNNLERIENQFKEKTFLERIQERSCVQS